MKAELAVWAPNAAHVTVVGGSRPRVQMDGPDGDDWFRVSVDLGPDDCYSFSLDSGPPRPDPRSPWQPEGVHGPSRPVDHGAFAWTDAAWTGRALEDAVVYELHVGTFSPEGTFDGAAARLDHLVDLGVDVVELMPVAQFPGRRGWGYDGVDLYAPHEPYGGPEGLKRLVDACHARGLAVVIDVVYNHLGPAGNYLSEFGPYFTDRYTTPWGMAVNMDGADSDEVRDFVLGNALTWLRDYHADGLRLDAVHAIVDTSAVHVLEELAGRVEALAADLGRRLFLIAESDLNDPAWCITRRSAATASTPSGATTSTTPCTPSSPVSGRATTPTSARSNSWPSRSGRPTCTTGTTHPTAAGGTAGPPPACTPPGSSGTCRTTTRSATEPPVSGRRCCSAPLS